MAIYSGFSHEKWWFSIVMLNYQRVSHPPIQLFTYPWPVGSFTFCTSLGTNFQLCFFSIAIFDGKPFTSYCFHFFLVKKIMDFIWSVGLTMEGLSPYIMGNKTCLKPPTSHPFLARKIPFQWCIRWTVPSFFQHYPTYFPSCLHHFPIRFPRKTSFLDVWHRFSYWCLAGNGGMINKFNKYINNNYINQ